MDITTIATLVFLVLLCAYAFVAKGKGAKIFRSIMFTLIAFFCVFGFLSTYEPMENKTILLAFRVGYAIFSLLFFTLAIQQIRSFMKKRNKF